MLYRSPAYSGLRLRSLARLYQTGVNLITTGRKDLLYIRVQNRGVNSVYFWHGLVPNQAGTGLLPLLVTEWTPTEKTYAESLLEDYGEKIVKDFIWEPSCAHTGPLYSLVRNAAAEAMVILGFQEDQEQGAGSFSERE
jgi:hypothetical protein